MLDGRKAQIGETMTWIVATLVIVVILGISVFVAVPFGKLGGFRFERNADLLATKSLTNYLSKKEGNSNIYNNLKNVRKLSEEDRKIFEKLYDEEYKAALLGIYKKDDFYVSGEFYDEKCSVDVKIELNEEREVGLCLLFWERK